MELSGDFSEKRRGWNPLYLSPTFIGQFTIFTMVQMNNKEMVSHSKLFNNEGREKELMMNWAKTSSKKKIWRSMRIDSRERRRGLTPFILLPAHFSSRPHPSSLRGEGLNFFGFAEKVLYAPQLPRRSSPGVGAVRRDEREGEERGK